jgi:molybdate transport system substrate-binding protein
MGGKSQGRCGLLGRIALFLGVFALLLPAVLPAGAGAVANVTVLAAASLTDAMEEIGTAYRGKTGATVRFSFASSSALARQIAAGAPADIFISANAAWMEDIEKRGLIEAGTRKVLARNALVVIVPAGVSSNTSAFSAAPDFTALLGERGRLAVGDPDHVPAGIYARQALQAWGVWEQLEPRLARADNVRAALALVARGEAPAGIVYATDVQAEAMVSTLGTFPESLHEPIVNPVAVIAGRASPAVMAFADFLSGMEAKAILQAHGFAVE